MFKHRKYIGVLFKIWVLWLQSISPRKRRRSTFGLGSESEVVVHQLAPGCKHQGHGVIMRALVPVYVGRHHARVREWETLAVRPRFAHTCADCESHCDTQVQNVMPYDRRAIAPNVRTVQSAKPWFLVKGELTLTKKKRGGAHSLW
jgi:hypothetical protein